MRLSVLPLSVIGLLLLSGCEESVSPILESELKFTLYGTLDMARDTQFVRVTPIRGTLEPGPPTPLDVVFTSHDLHSGEVLAWRDSIIDFPDGTYGHVFYAPLRLHPGHPYLIELRETGSEVVTSATTTVPEAPAPEVQPETVRFSVTGGIVSVVGSQRVLWRGVHWRPHRVEQWYRFVPGPSLPFQDILLPYEPNSAPSSDENGTWQVDLNLATDRRSLDSLVNVRGTPLAGLALQITILDAAFEPPGGVFDPEVLVEPETFTNVHNGLGFIGSVGRFAVEWVLQADSQELLGYRHL